MLKSLKIAITGGVASGKSSVCRFFQELGAFVVSADAIVHELLKPDSVFGKQVIHQLDLKPPIPSDGEPFRKMIAKKVFENPKLLETLEGILHPEVARRIETLYLHHSDKDLFIVELPLLFEAGFETFFNCTVAVVSDEAIARKRWNASGFSSQEYGERMKRQMSPSQKAHLANYTLFNNGSLEDLKKQVIQLHQTLSRNYESRESD